MIVRLNRDGGEVEVEVTVTGGYPGTYMEPPEPPEVDVVEVVYYPADGEEAQEGVELSDSEMEEVTEQAIEQHQNNPPDYD